MTRTMYVLTVVLSEYLFCRWCDGTFTISQKALDMGKGGRRKEWIFTLLRVVSGLYVTVRQLAL